MAPPLLDKIQKLYAYVSEDKGYIILWGKWDSDGKNGTAEKEDDGENADDVSLSLQEEVIREQL